MVNPLVFPILACALAKRNHPGNVRAIRETARRLGKQWPEFRPFTLLIINAKWPDRIIDQFMKEWEL